MTRRRAEVQAPLPRLFTRAELREIDRLAVVRFKIPSIVLMENAASAIARTALDMASSPNLPMRSAIVICGPGNNGGDGLAVARHLLLARLPTAIVLSHRASARTPADTRTNLRVLRAMGAPITLCPSAARASTLLASLAASLPGPTLLLDALLGTGATRPIDARSTTAALITGINALRRRRRSWRTLAVDLPSGLDAQTGAGLAPDGCVHADATVTLVGLKPGLLTPLGAAAAGTITIAGIGAPLDRAR